MEAFLQIAVIGAALSVAIEWVQARFGTGTVETRLIAVILSVVLGALVWFVSKNTEIWEAVLGILAAASTVYAMYFSGRKNNAESN